MDLMGSVDEFEEDVQAVPWLAASWPHDGARGQR